MKSNPQNIVQENTAKSLLNNLLGRFGMDFTKPITDIVNKSEYDRIMLNHTTITHKDITDDDFF